MYDLGLWMKAFMAALSTATKPAGLQ